MDFRILEIFNRSVTIELISDDIFCQDHEFDIMLDGKKVMTTDRNVISVAGLLPDRQYRIGILDPEDDAKDPCEKSFTTGHETVLFNVRNFGAKGDGTTSDTSAIQAAICACPENGTVYLPKGVYYSTALFLKSHMTLWLDEGAVLLGDIQREHYPILPGMTPTTDEKGEINLSSWEGNPLTSFASLITAIGVTDLDIIGPGVIDGNAQNSDWWVNPKEKRIAWRPNTMFLAGCKNVRVQNVTVQNSPSWTVHPYYSDDLSFLNLFIHNPSDSPNTDGLDPESCNNVKVLGTVISVGDDCMAIKSGKYYMSLKHHKVTENVVVRNCKLERGHGSVTVGSEAAGGVKNVRVSQCIFEGTDRGLRIKTRRGRGEKSVLDDILFENIKMDGVLMPFTVNMFYFCDPDGHSDYVQNQEPAPVDEMTPSIGSITGRNITCEGVSACLLCAVGLPESPMGELVLENVSARFMPEEDRKPVTPVMMDNFEEMSGRSIYVKNCKKLVLKKLDITGSVDTEPELYCVDDKQISDVIYH